MTYRKLIILFFLFISFNLFSQRQLKQANLCFEKEQYYQAIELYKEVINKNKINNNKILAQIYYNLASSYLKISEAEMAAKYFILAINHNYSDPIVYHYFGESLQMLQLLDSALVQYQKFNSLVETHKFKNKGINSILFVKEQLNNPSLYNVKIVNNINSSEQDYCPFLEVRNQKKIFFTSTRKTGDSNVLNLESGDNCSNIYYSEKDKQGNWTNPTILSGEVNTTWEEGAACLNRRSNNLYFTRCQYFKKKDKACRIFMAKKTGNSWSQVQQVDIKGIPNHISIGHPAISEDELSLYFVADSLEGSIGGKDIYKVTRSNKNLAFGSPQNLSYPINTEEDEIHPYIRCNGDLYFSSNGHKGMGGFDIFLAKQDRNGKYIIYNMGYPINCMQDDFGIVFLGMREEGYFSSKRSLGMGKTDIQYFILPELKFTISGTIYDKKTNQKLSNVDVQVMDENFVLMDSQMSDENGNYEIDLKPDINYIIYYKLKSYDLEKINLELKDQKDSKNFLRDVFLQR